MVPRGELFGVPNLGNDRARDQALLNNPPHPPWDPTTSFVHKLLQLAHPWIPTGSSGAGPSNKIAKLKSHAARESGTKMALAMIRRIST